MPVNFSTWLGFLCSCIKRVDAADPGCHRSQEGWAKGKIYPCVGMWGLADDVNLWISALCQSYTHTERQCFAGLCVVLPSVLNMAAARAAHDQLLSLLNILHWKKQVNKTKVRVVLCQYLKAAELHPLTEVCNTLLTNWIHVLKKNTRASLRQTLSLFSFLSF